MSWRVHPLCSWANSRPAQATWRSNKMNNCWSLYHLFWLIYCRIIITVSLFWKWILFCWAVLYLMLSACIFMLLHDYFCLCRQMLRKHIHIHPSPLISSLFHRITSLFVVWLLHCEILICMSWCSPSGLSWIQIAALFISLVINITFCSATFPGNNSDNGTSTLLSLFFLSPSHCWSESHFCEQQACQFYLQAIWNFAHFFSLKPHFVRVE